MYKEPLFSVAAINPVLYRRIKALATCQVERPYVPFVLFLIALHMFLNRALFIGIIFPFHCQLTTQGAATAVDSGSERVKIKKEKKGMSGNYGCKRNRPICPWTSILL